MITRKFRCTGCGTDRPCVLTFTQEKHNVFDTIPEDLTCVLDSTNQTSYNWKESTKFKNVVKKTKKSIEDLPSEFDNEENVRRFDYLQST